MMNANNNLAKDELINEWKTYFHRILTYNLNSTSLLPMMSSTQHNDSMLDISIAYDKFINKFKSYLKSELGTIKSVELDIKLTDFYSDFIRSCKSNYELEKFEAVDNTKNNIFYQNAKFKYQLEKKLVIKHDIEKVKKI